MEIKRYTEYDIADVTDEDIKNICELEKSLSTKNNEDVVLIAYKHMASDKTES